MGLFVGGFGYAGEKEIKKELLDNGMYDENGSYNGFNKIDTKKPLNHLKLNENKVVLTEDLLILRQDNLFKFVLKGQNNNCNIIREGKIANLQIPDSMIELGYIISEGKMVESQRPDCCAYNVVCDGQTLGEAYTINETIKIFDKNKKISKSLKYLLSQDEILISGLLNIENKINEKELEKRVEKSEIRSRYGF